ncbi:hypothetical protein RE815_004208 [Escherichia coli]|nr:hypothetical protein [Escherichia coli]
MKRHLNTSYRLVWNHITGTLVVASELARSRGKRTGVAVALSLATVTSVPALAADTVVQAGETVNGGTLTNHDNQIVLGTANGMTISTGLELGPDSEENTGGQWIQNGGIAGNTTVTTNGRQVVLEGGTASDTVIRDGGGQSLNGLAVNTTLNNRGEQWVHEGGVADVSAGRLFVLVNKFDEKDRNGDGADTVRQKVPAMLNSDVLPASRVYPGSSRQAYLANRALHELRKTGALPADEAWVDDFVREAFGRMKKEHICKDSELVTEGATELWEGSLIDKLITEVIQSSHSRAAALAVDSAAAKLMQNAENVSEYLSLRHQGLQQSIQSLQVHITSLLADIQEIEKCQNQVTGDVKIAMDNINTKTRELLTGVCTSLEEALNDYFRSGKRKEQQMLEEENSAQPRERNAFAFFHDIFGTGNQHDRMRDFDPDSPEIKFSDRREALKLMTQIESTVASLHREAEAQFRPELEKIVRGIETGFRGTALYATENIAGRINARLEDEGFTVKISFPAVSQLQTRIAVKTNLSALMEERTETVTRRRRKDSFIGKICGWIGTKEWGWENYNVDVSRSVININKVRKEVMSLTRAYFGELQASIEQNINQPVRQEIDAFFCAFREKVEQLRNTLIQSSEDHKRDQQAQERLTERLQALNERVPELITDSKALREELETLL